MLNEDIVMPMIDTQKLSWELWGMNQENRIRFKKNWKDKKVPNSGVYGLYHRRFGAESCLYIGASIRLKERTARFFQKNSIIENPYLYWMLEGITKSEQSNRLTVYFYYTNDIYNLGLYEKYFVEKYKPILNLTQTYHKLQQRTIDTHTNV